MLITRTDINTYLPAAKKYTDADIAEAFSLHAFEVEEVTTTPEKETVFDIDVLPNRSSDALSVVGLLRELAAILQLPFDKDPFLQPEPTFPATDALSTAIPEGVPASFFSLALIEGVQVGPSPRWLQEFLRAHGQRPINNIVDATNYVLLFYGQPTHAFDADALQSPPAIGPRLLEAPHTIELLDGEARELPAGVMVITDLHSQEPLGVAGVKGGAKSAVSDATTRVILEAARFDPTVIRKTARALNLHTDAAKRFENDVPDALPRYGLAALIDLVISLAGGTLTGVAQAETSRRTPVVLPRDDTAINTLLGTDIPSQTITDILSRLGIVADDAQIQVPWWRTDITRTEDIAEEVVRLYGLRNIAAKTPPPSTRPKTLLANFYWAEKLRAFLTDRGFIEVTNSTLQDRGELKLKNALASDKNYYRDSLSYQLQKALDKNEPFLPLVGLYAGQRLFEIGNVYRNGTEQSVFAIALRPSGKKKRQQKVAQAFAELAKELESAFGVRLPEPPKDAEVWEIPMSIFPEPPEQAYPDLPVVTQQYRPFSPYPFVLRDLAVWLPQEVAAEEPLAIIKKHGGALVVRADLFDVFEKDGRTSYAYHIVFQAPDRTLTDVEVNDIMEQITRELTARGGEVR